MPKVTLGTLKAVDVGDVWMSEPYDFTPWLADNLELLSEAVGFNLDLIGTEVYVDKYKLDILAESEGIGLVAIENQLSWSDSKHLGQLLTYASGLDARGVIWVSRRFEPAHLAAIRWLNRWTLSDLGFYAVEVGAVRIGEDESVAPVFKVVVEPQDFVTQSVADPVQAGLSGFHADLLEEVQVVEALAEGSKNGGVWVPLQLPFPHIGFTLRMTPKQGWAVHLYFECDQPAFTESVFNALQTHQESIDAEFDQNLIWKLFKFGGRVRMMGNGSPDETPERLAEIRIEMIATYHQLRSVIEPYLADAIESARAKLDSEEA